MFEINKSYTFSTIASGILGSNFKNLKVLSLTNAIEAVKYSDVFTMNEQINAEVGNTLPHAHNMTYVLFENVSKEKIILSIDWININSIEVVSELNAMITIRNISNLQLQSVTRVLRELGLINTTIEVVD